MNLLSQRIMNRKEVVALIEIKGFILNDESVGPNGETNVLATYPRKVKEALDNEPSDDVDVYINSEGGELMGGTEIYSLLRDSDKKIHVKVVGMAGSAASLIACAGDDVSMSPGSVFMIHNASTNGSKFDGVLDTFNEGVANIYSLKTGLPRDELHRMMSSETWMTAGEAIKLGFADQLMFEDDKELVALAKGDKNMNEDEKNQTPVPKEGAGTNEALDVLKSIDKHLGNIEAKLPDKPAPAKEEDPKPGKVENAADDVLKALFG